MLLPSVLPTVVFRALPEGGVLFSTDSEVYFGLNEVGARIWENLPPVCATVDELVGKLAALYSDVEAETIRADVLEILGQFTTFGLVRAADPASAGGRSAEQL